jgi:Tfp pilus assembly protein PilN
VRAVNLIPADARRGGVSPSLGRLGASHVLIAILAIAVGYVSFYVLTNNKISQRQTQLAGLQQQVTREKAAVARLDSYQKFEQLAQARAQTVRQIADSRFDWHSAMEDLSKVVPSNTTLQSLTATVSPTSSATGGSGGSASGIRGAINAPAFEMTGCTGSQDEVAQLMSRLRLINGVSRVTLGQSTKAAGGSTSSATTSAGSPHNCAGGPSFDMVVFFQPQANALPSTGTGAAATPSAGTGAAATPSTGGSK